MNLLVVLADDVEAHALAGLLHERARGVAWLRVATLDAARRALTTRVFDAVLVRLGPKRLGFGAFVPFVARLPREPKLLVVGDEAPGAATLADGPPAQLVDQALAVLGIARSERFEHEVLAELERDDALELDLVRLPGSTAPLVRASATRPLDDFELHLARRAAAVKGPGLPEVLEAFWDDPQPHLVSVVPRGTTLARALERLDAVSLDAALALTGALAHAFLALHEANVAAGPLSTGRVWLTVDGALFLLGNGFAQVPARRRRFGLTVPGVAPPEEVGGDVPPGVAGDAFRLGALLVRLATGRRPFGGVGVVEFLRGDWPPWSDEVRHALGRAEPLLDLLLAFVDGDRPRGPLLAQVLGRVAPKAPQRLLAEWVAASGAALLG